MSDQAELVERLRSIEEELRDLVQEIAKGIVAITFAIDHGISKILKPFIIHFFTIWKNKRCRTVNKGYFI